MNSSTDICENKLFVIFICKTGNTLQEAKTCARYFAYWSQQRLMQVGWCLSRALKFIGIENLLERECVFLVLMNSQFLWAVVLMVYQSMYLIRMAHKVNFMLLYFGCIELSAMITSLNFHVRMFFQLSLPWHWYYTVEIINITKKCHEHSDLIGDLKEVPKGGSLPVQAHGSCWITQNWNFYR